MSDFRDMSTPAGLVGVLLGNLSRPGRLYPGRQMVLAGPASRLDGGGTMPLAEIARLWHERRQPGDMLLPVGGSVRFTAIRPAAPYAARRRRP